MRLVIKTNGNCSQNCSIDLDGKSIGFTDGIDIKFRPDGVKVVARMLHFLKGERFETIRTFYVNGESTFDTELDEVDEKSEFMP